MDNAIYINIRLFMELKKLNTYLPVDFRGIGKGGAYCHLFPETNFTRKQLDKVCSSLNMVYEKYEDLYTNTMLADDIISIAADLSDFPKKSHNEILEAIASAMNSITGIKKAIISADRNCSIDDEETETEENDMIDENYWDDALGLTKLDLSYTAHVDGFDGECFDYNIYFADDTADETKADAVRNAVQSFDFNVTGDDYIGYLSISSDNNKVSIYLDLGNVQPQNENKIIQGILLALNSVPEIKKVIINEGCI